LLGRPSSSFEDNIEMGTLEIRWEAVDWIQLA
jgi:hypothetical protein